MSKLSFPENIKEAKENDAWASYTSKAKIKSSGCATKLDGAPCGEPIYRNGRVYLKFCQNGSCSGTYRSSAKIEKGNFQEIYSAYKKTINL